MEIKIGTFNLNNLFSRFNFSGELKAIKKDDSISSTLTYSFSDPENYKIKKFKGKLIKDKNPKKLKKVVERIKKIDCDILAVQEVEDIETLKFFNKNNLNNMYSDVTLIEGNDIRFIDVGILSKYPIGKIISWRHATHKSNIRKKIFGRDLLQVEILNEKRTKTLFTIFNNHLKSHFIDFREKDKEKAKKENDDRRKKQAECIGEIVISEMRPSSKFIILGDMNDPPDSAYLKGFTKNKDLKIMDALKNPKVTRDYEDKDNPPKNVLWTHRYKESKKPPVYELFDQIWLSSALSSKLVESWIDRRKNKTGDGSDHDPAWIVLKL